MADSQPASPAHDSTTAEHTVYFIGRQMRISQFQLKAAVVRRQQAVRHESSLRQTIQGLQKRIEREFDKDPALFRKLKEGSAQESGE